MGKTQYVPKCGSNRIKILVPQTGIWTCLKCGYQGGILIEDSVTWKNKSKQLRKWISSVKSL